MTCYHPLEAYQGDLGEIEFQDKGGRPLKLPCGQCIGCRLDRSREWATRCVHEAQLHEDNCFITLTYNPKNLPPDAGLVKKDFQDFMKRLRRSLEAPYSMLNKDLSPKTYVRGKNKGKVKLGRTTVKKIKYYMCGEYGDRTNRPHYHAIIFNHNFDDWVYLYTTEKGSDIYTSPNLEKIWGLGFVTIGEVTFESAAYVARYVMKKINGQKAEEINPETGLKHYERINSFTGEISEVLPEYATMSRGGRTGRGIAHDWISDYTSDIYPKGFTTIRGMKIKPPRYYDNYLKEVEPDMHDDIKEGRKLAMIENFKEGLPERLKQKEKVKQSQFKQLTRSL